MIRADLQVVALSEGSWRLILAALCKDQDDSEFLRRRKAEVRAEIVTQTSNITEASYPTNGEDTPSPIPIGE